MKILRRNFSHHNVIIFLILSLIYLHAIYSLSSGSSLFTLKSPASFFSNHYLVFLMTCLAGYMVIKLKKFSEIVLLFCLITIVGKSFVLLSDSFNKLTLVLNFIYLVFAFYFFITWELEVALASFNPKFSHRDLEKESRFKLRAYIGTNSGGENSIPVLITNIDHESCFLLMPEVKSLEKSLEINPSMQYYLKSEIEGTTFSHSARLVSSYDRGIGLRFESAENNRVSWSELYKVCQERGIVA